MSTLTIIAHGDQPIGPMVERGHADFGQLANVPFVKLLVLEPDGIPS